VLVYVGAAAFAFIALVASLTLSVLSAGTLLRRRGPLWLAGVGAGIVLASFATRTTTTFGCVSSGALAKADNHVLTAVVLAVAAVAKVLFVWFRVARR
jgi:hypothetical protein